MTDPTLFDDPTGGGRRATVSGRENPSATHGPSTLGGGAGSGGVARRHPVRPGETPATPDGRVGRDSDARQRPGRPGETPATPDADTGRDSDARQRPGRPGEIPATPDGRVGRDSDVGRRPVPPSETPATPHDCAAHDAVGRVAGQVEALLVGLRSLGGELLEERLGLVGRCEAGLAAVRSETVAELARRDGDAKAAEAVRDRLRQSRGRAKRDVKLAGQLADLAGTAQALADGDITPQHARIIAEAAEHTDVDEDELLDAAATQPTDVFGHTVREHVNERSAGEDLAERRRRQRARRELSIKRQSDGMYKLFGLFDPVAGARIETALDAAARKIRHGEDPANRATVPQRYADALELLATTGNGAAGARSTTLLVVAEYEAVAGRVAGAHLPDGTPVTADELVGLAVEAKVLPAIFDTPGRPLWLGRASRDANAAQRIALAARRRLRRLRRQAQHLRTPPREALGARRPHRYRQPVPALRPLPSHRDPRQRR